MGVCDGHGLQGHLVSNYVKINLPKILNETIHLQNGPQNNDYQKDDGQIGVAPWRKNNKKGRSFLPPLFNNKAQGRNVHDYDSNNYYNEESQVQSENEQQYQKKPSILVENWFSNENQKVRDKNIKEAFLKTEIRLEKKTRIDAMFSGTTSVIVFFDQNIIVSANAGDSRAILISSHEPMKENG